MPFKSERPHADCDGVHGFRIRRGEKAILLKKKKEKKQLCIKEKANVRVPTGWETAFMYK